MFQECHCQTNFESTNLKCYNVVVATLEMLLFSSVQSRLKFLLPVPVLKIK